MQNPRPRVVGYEADSHTITSAAGVYGITHDGVDIVIIATSGTSDDSEAVLGTTYY
jgi:hypothetical protein